MSLVEFNNPNTVISQSSRIIEVQNDTTGGLPEACYIGQDGKSHTFPLFSQATVYGFPDPQTHFTSEPDFVVSGQNEKVVSYINGGCSSLIAISAEVSPELGVSRTLIMFDPEAPNTMLKLGGIGVCKEEGGNITVTEPDPSRRMDLQTKDTKLMRARTLMPNGQILHATNKSTLGAYEAPGIFDKVDRHARIADRLINHGLHTTKQSMVVHRDNTPYYLLSTVMPTSVNFSELGGIEAWAMCEGHLKQPLIGLASTFLRFNMLSRMQRAGIVHNQYTGTNARISAVANGHNVVIPNDFSDSALLENYPENIYATSTGTGIRTNLREFAQILDFEHALHLALKEQKGGDFTARAKMATQIVGAAIEGFCQDEISISQLRARCREFQNEALLNSNTNDQTIHGLSKHLTKLAINKVFCL